MIGNTVGGKPSAVLLAAYLAESVNILPDDLEELIPELLIMIGVDEVETSARDKTKATMMIISVYRAVKLMNQSVEYHLDHPEEDEEQPRPITPEYSLGDNRSKTINL